MKNIQPLYKLLLIATLLIFAVSEAKAVSTSLVINEIMYDPVGDEADGEWVEIYVQTSPGNLEDWTLSDTASNTYTFPNFTPAAGDYIVIHTGIGTDNTTGPVHHLYWGRGSGVWNNTGDEVLLADNNSIEIDYIAYEGASTTINGSLTWGGSNPSASEGNSIALKNNGVDSDSGDDWEEAGTSVTIGPDSQGGSNNVTPCTTDCYVDANTGSDSNSGMMGNPFATIQKAIDTVDPNGTVHIADGTYNEAPNVDKAGVTVDGESESGTIIDASSINDYSIDVTVDDVTLQDFTLIGNPAWSAAYGIKVGGEPATRLSNFTVKNVTVNTSHRTGIDLNGVDGALIQNVEVKNVPSGNGLAITDSNDVVFENITTSNNAWGGLAIYTYGRYFSLGSDNVTIQGTNSFGEANKVYVERGNYNNPASPEPVTNLTVNGFAYTVMNDTFRAGGENFTFYQISQSDAINFALGLTTPEDSYVNQISNGHFWVGQDAFNSMTIQAAVDHATSGDVINVLAGTFVENGQIVIDKDLTINGDSKITTIVKTNQDTGSSSDSRGWWLVESGVEFHLSDMTLDGTGYKVYQAIRHKGFGSIDNVAFTEIKFNEGGPTYSGVAVAAFGTGPVDITNSMFNEIGRVGVLYFGSGVNGSLFEGNMYTGKGPGDWLDYALDIGAGAEVEVKGNTISGNRGVASSDGSTSAGILVTTYFGSGTAAQIYENDISDSSTGIFVGYDGSDTSSVVANYNNITGNDNGVRTTAPVVDATFNWWGDVSGPSGAGPGIGDSVDADVIICPWLDAPFPGGSPTNSGGIVTNVDTSEVFCNIQAAVDDSDTLNGHTLELSAHTFTGNGNENVHVNKEVTLVGQGPANTLIDPSINSPFYGFYIDADNVTIKEMTFNDAVQAIRFEQAGGTINNTEINNVHFIDNSNRGIEIHNATTVTNLDIINGRFDNNNVGIRMASSSTVDGLLISNTTFITHSLAVYQANDGGTSTLRNLHIDDSTFINSTDTAVFAEEIRDSVIENSTFTNNRRGITIFKEYTGAGVNVENVTIRHNEFTNSTNWAVLLWQRNSGLGGTFAIEENTINQDVSILTADYAQIDIRLDSAFGHAPIIIADNTVNLSGTFAGATAAHAIKVRGGSDDITITKNKLDGGNVGDTGGVPPTSGIYLVSNDSTMGAVAATAQINITKNDILNFVNGISVYDDVNGVFGGVTTGADVNINRNNIVGNGDGLVNADPEPVDATCNWWGATNGPSGIGLGSGDIVSNFATFEPWLTALAPDGPCDGVPVGTLEITKVVVPDDGFLGPFLGYLDIPGWDFELDATTPFILPGQGGTTSFDDIAAGSHTIVETPDTANFTTAYSCDGAAPQAGTTATATVPVGGTSECVFTNTLKTGFLKLVKVVEGIPPASDWDFHVSGPFGIDVDGSLDKGGETVPDVSQAPFLEYIPVPLGQYTISEITQNGYESEAICTNSLGGTVGSGTDSVSFEVAPALAITCTFTNSAIGIDLEKLVNGQDADSVPGDNIPVGGPVEFEFIVTNSGQVPLDNINLDDDKVDVSSCVIPTSLAPGESFNCTVNDTTVLGQHSNMAIVTADTPQDQQVSDEDQGHYFGIDPMNWAFECVEHRMEVTGIGMGNPGDIINPQSLSLADPASVNWMLAQLAGRARLPLADVPTSVEFSTDAPQTVTLNAPSSFVDSFGYTFESTLQPTNNISALVNGTGSASFQTPRALMLYANRNVDLNTWTSMGQTLNEFIWHGAGITEKSRVISIPALPIDTDITVTAVVVDNNDDSRPMVVEASAAGITASTTEIGPGPEGDLLNIVVLTLANVPAGTDEVTITVKSPEADNGDSLAWVGLNVSYVCDDDRDDDTIPNNTEGDLDPDGDSTPNYLDTDSDGDTILDSVEWNSDANGDNVIDSFDRDADQDGQMNFLDLDSDNDGKLDEEEGLADENNNGILDFVEVVPGAGGSSGPIYLPIVIKSDTPK